MRVYEYRKNCYLLRGSLAHHQIMNKKQMISTVETFKKRLKDDVFNAYTTRGSDFGQDRFDSWCRSFTKFLSKYLPDALARFEEKLSHQILVINHDESDYDAFLRRDGKPVESFLDSLTIDIENDDHNMSMTTSNVRSNNIRTKNSKVFIVHGHDENIKQQIVRFLEQLGITPIILEEQPNQGKTIIEKIEKYSKVKFGIVLYTSDDLGNEKQLAKDQLNQRARQNVILEHGYLMGKIGRKNVVPLVAKGIEFPSDLHGVVYVDEKDWRIKIAKEMKASGYSIDFNKLL